MMTKASTLSSGGIESPASGKENRKPKATKNAKEGKKKPEKKHNDAPHQPGTLQEAIGRVSIPGQLSFMSWTKLYYLLVR